jgi:hypothetical protein
VKRGTKATKVEPYLAGKRAWQNDQLTEGNNPYPPGSEESNRWLAGYREARQASLGGGPDSPRQ